MRRLIVTTAVAVGLFALACTDERQESPTEPPSTATTAKTCPSLDPIQSQICALFPANDLRQSASDFYNNIKTKLGKDPAFAKARAVDLVNFTFKQYYAGKLVDPDGSGPSTIQGGVVQLTCSVLNYVGSGWANCSTDLTTGLNTTSASPHSTVQVCGPAGCLVRPPDKHSGVSVPATACPTLCIIAVDPIPPNFASPRDGPLSGLTNLDQYPLFREFNLVASFNEFAVPVIVGLCHLKASDGGPFAPPDDATEKRLQLAHPDPNNSESIEILAKVAAPFLDCSDLFATNDEFTASEVGTGRTSHLGDFASAAGTVIGRTLVPVLQKLLPERAEAAVMGSCCLGGATTKFSPWAAVDPESGQEITFFSSPDFGTDPFDPAGQTFDSRFPLSWIYNKDGSSFQAMAFPAIQVLDQNGNPQSGVDVTVSLVPVDGSGTLSGTLTRSTSGGNTAAGPDTAVFDDLIINQDGTYRLRFTAGSLTIDSGIFSVLTGPG